MTNDPMDPPRLPFRWTLLAAILGAVLGRPAAAQEPPTWLAVGPKAAERGLFPLAYWRREGGLAPRFLAFEDVPKGDLPLNRRVQQAIAAMVPRPAYILLIGDGAGDASSGAWVLPPFRPEGDTAYLADPDPATRSLSVIFLESDVPFGDFDADLRPDASVGRFPVRDAAELAVLVHKTLRYERDVEPGPWQREAAFVTGEGHYGAILDTMIERTFAKIVDETLPADVDVDVTYANPSSSYFWPAPDFAGFVKRRLEAGSLFFTYVGHGSRSSVDHLRIDERPYDVLSIASVADLAASRAPAVMTILACHTGAFAASRDCVLEVLVRAEGGPVAGLGATIMSAPYGNAIFGYELARTYFDRKLPRLGDAIDTARRALLETPKAGLRKGMEALARLVPGASGDLAKEARDHVLMYVLLGDPALRLRRPLPGLGIEAPASAPPGATVEVTAAAPGGSGPATFTLECARTKMARPLPPRPKGTDERADEIIRGRHDLSNDKVVLRVEAAPEEGRFRAALPLPRDLPAGAYVLKVATGAGFDLHTGFRGIRIEPR